MAHDFEQKYVGLVALIIGAVVLLLGLGGLILNLSWLRFSSSLAFSWVSYWPSFSRGHCCVSWSLRTWEKRTGKGPYRLDPMFAGELGKSTPTKYDFDVRAK